MAGRRDRTGRDRAGHDGAGGGGAGHQDPAALARRILARPPAPPRRPALFSSNTLFGEPGLYPGGPPMEPAAGPPATGAALEALVERTVAAGGGDVAAARRRLADPALDGCCDDLALRAALALLAVTVAAPAAAAFPGRTTARALAFGAPASPGRVVGPWAPSGTAAPDPARRAVNERYRAEHPALLAPSLAHDLLWSPGATGHAAEALLHALCAMVHVQLVAREPALAHLGTELCRRQNSLAITLCNSRRAGSDRIVLVAPDGPGTIPGGAPSMQTPDFWSVPFAPAADVAAPALAAEVFAPLVDPDDPDDPDGAPGPFTFSEPYGRWFGRHLARDWLPPLDQLRAAVALGLVGPEVVAAEVSGQGALDALGLSAALAVWEEPGGPGALSGGSSG